MRRRPANARPLLFAGPLLAGVLLATSACTRAGEDAGSAGAAPAPAKSAGPAPAQAPAKGWDPAQGTPPPAASPPAGSWVEFRSEEAGFTARFPKAPESSVIPVDTVAGKIEQKMFSVEENDAFYAVTVSEYPAAFVQMSDASTMLDGARDGAVGNIAGKLVREEQVQVEGAPCRKIVVTGNKQGISLEIDALLCMADVRLLQAILVRPSGKLPAADVQRFLGSMKPIRR